MYNTICRPRAALLAVLATLLALMTAERAEAETLFSYTVNTNEKAANTEYKATGGTMSYGTSKFDDNGFKADQGLSKEKWMKVTMSGKTLQAGDQLTFRIFADQDNSGVCISLDKTSAAAETNSVSASNAAQNVTYTVTTGDKIAGQSTIYLFRKGTVSICIQEVTIERNAVGKTYSYKVYNGEKGPKPNTVKIIKDDSGNPLVAMTFGGWRWNNGTWQSKEKKDQWLTDTWKDGATTDQVASIDGYEYGFSGTNDACDEAQSPSLLHGETHYGWFWHQNPVKSQVPPHGVGEVKTYPFTLPCRGSFMTFNCKKNGQLTIYVIQNGAWNTEGTASTIIKGEFRTHSFYLVNQRGLDVLEFSPEGTHSVTTMQKVTDQYHCDSKTKKGYYDRNSTNIADWEEFNTFFSKAEQQRIEASWKNGKNGAQTIVELDDGSYLGIQKGIVRYTFRATGNETYYFFSNRSKMGFCGATFTPDADSDQPQDKLELSDTKKFEMPHLSNGEWRIGNTPIGNVKNVPAPQFKSITLNRTFKKKQWATLSLPFDMTQDEVKRIFGWGTQLIMLKSVTSKNSFQSSADLHFFYHEIQSVLPGYPYLIYPTLEDANGADLPAGTQEINNLGGEVTIASDGKSITSFTVSNKYINPHVKLSPQVCKNYTAKCTPEYSTDSETNASGKAGYSKRYEDGDIFVSDGDGKLYVSTGQSYGKGYRSYIEWTPKTTAARRLAIGAMDFSASDENEEFGGQPTAITAAELSDEARETLGATGVYNLQGQRVAAPARGIYIINGKKTIMR